MIEDVELLRRYVEAGSQDAFGELVQRRIDLVYSVALRQVGGDAHLAKDVTQKVFADLARKASTLLDRAVLTGWLYRSTQFAASDVVRSERRRRAREQESQAMHEISLNPTAAADWDKVRPVLDEAMGELSEDDRDAVALRFFEGRAFAEIGDALELTEEAARKRVDRALDRMAAALSRRGVTSTAAAITVALGSHVMAAPPGLAAMVTSSALSGTVAVAGATALGLTMTAKFSLAVAGVVAVTATGIALYQAEESRVADVAFANLSGEHAALRARIQALEQQLAAEQSRAQTAEADNSLLLSAIAAHVGPTVPTQATESGPLTHDVVDARYRRGKELAKSGQAEAALREFLWCFDIGMPPVAGFGGVRTSYLLGDIARLIESHPPALAALHERRDAAEKRLRASARDFDAATTFAAINRTLKESNRTLALMDEFPADDRRRDMLARVAFDTLVENRRYAEAARVRPAAQMRSQFESNSTRPVAVPPGVNAAPVAQANRNYVINSAAKNVEVLAGAGDIAAARELASKVLAYDNTPHTRALLQEHAARAGQGDLLNQL